MRHEKVREKLSLVQTVLDEIVDCTSDTFLANHIDEASENINSGIARLDALTNTPSGQPLKNPTL